MDESMIGLMACPFCGSAPELYEIKAYRKRSPLKGKYRARCTRGLCIARKIRAAYDTKEDAAWAWNRRT